MVSAILLLGIALVTLVLVRSFRTFFTLRHFGGHWSAGWSRLWLLRTQSSGEMHKRFTVITDKYGEWLYHVVGYLLKSSYSPPVAQLASSSAGCVTRHFSDYHMITTLANLVAFISLRSTCAIWHVMPLLTALGRIYCQDRTVYAHYM